MSGWKWTEMPDKNCLFSDVSVSLEFSVETNDSSKESSDA